MAKTQNRPHIVIAAAGSGGHLFPAQTLASSLTQKRPDLHITFIGAGLETNPYFKKGAFPFLDVCSGTPFKKNLIQIAQAFAKIGRGALQSLKFMRRQPPDLIVGFGSYHTFPPLCAAKLKKIPTILFESNLLPGRVNRLCSRWAALCAVQFSAAALQLKSKTVCVNLLSSKKGVLPSKEEARAYFGLEKERLTFLVFGGSQGSQRINALICQALDSLIKVGVLPQIIHILGSLKEKQVCEHFYCRYPVPVCLKVFEEKMEYAWRAADLNISRAGAGTIAELIAFSVPSLLIPYPYGSENHQMKNACFVTKKIKGGLLLEEKGLNGQRMAQAVLSLLENDQSLLKQKREALKTFKKEENKRDLCSIVLEAL